MAYEDGFYVTTKKVISRSQNTSGFSDLLLKGRTDLSVENLVIDDRYQSIFSTVEINLCKERLGVVD